MEQITMEQLAELLKVQIAGQARMEANQAESKAERKADKEESMAKMERLLSDNREMKATIRSGQEETRAAINSIQSELEEKINTQTQGLREELDEARQHLQVAMTSIDTWTGTLQDDITSAKKDLQTKLDVRAQELEDRIAEVEARAELGVGGRTGNDAGRAKPPKFDGSTSWSMFRRQFETVADRNR
jgi:hypothetical protein